MEEIELLVDNMELDKAISRIDEELSKSNINIDLKQELIIYKAKAFREKGNFSKGLDLLDHYSYNDIASDYLKYLYLIERSWLLFREGETEIGLKEVSRAKILSEDLEYELTNLEYSNLYYLIGLFYIDKLELDGAQEYLDKSLSYINKYEHKRQYSRITNVIGIVYFHRGDLSTSIDYYTHSLKINREIGDHLQEGINYNNIGYAYYLYGIFNKSKKFLNKAIDVFKQERFDYYIATAIFNLFRTLYVMDETELANSYLVELEKIASKPENVNNERIKCSYKICLGIKLMNTEKLKDFIKAEEIFKEIIDEDSETQFMIIAMVNLAEILLAELKIEKSEAVYEEMLDLMTKLHYYADKGSIGKIRIALYILEAKIHTINDKFEMAFICYKKAKDLASKKELAIYYDQVENELVELKKMVMKMKEIVDVNSTLTEKIKESKIQDYLQEIQKFI